MSYNKPISVFIMPDRKVDAHDLSCYIKERLNSDFYIMGDWSGDNWHIGITNAIHDLAAKRPNVLFIYTNNTMSMTTDIHILSLVATKLGLKHRHLIMTKRNGEWYSPIKLEELYD